MAEENTKDKSAYIFVDASTTKPDKSYADKPVYSYVYPAWEWLLERTLRRKLILSMFNKDAALAALTLHSGCYRMHRWPAFGNGSGCSSFKDSTHTRSSECHDGVLKEDFTDHLPTGDTNNETIVQGTVVKARLVSKDFDTVLGVVDLANEVYYWIVLNPIFLSSNQFLAPNCLPVEYSTTATIKEETSGKQESEGSSSLIWEGKVTEYKPYILPNHAFFRCLNDYRIDDPSVDVTINDSEGKSHKITLAKTIIAKRREDLPELDGKKVLYGGYSPLNLSGDLAFKTQTGLDSVLKKTVTAVNKPYGGREPLNYIGVIPGPIERVNDSAIYTDINYDLLQPNINWDGEPTWWHKNGFPIGLDSILSAELKNQLKDLSVTQPAIPPHIPYLREFPKGDYSCYEHRLDSYDFKDWPSGMLPIAATPLCINKMLDALTTTVIPFDALFVEIEANTIRNVHTDITSTSGQTSWTNFNTSTTIKGTLISKNILTCDSKIISQNQIKDAREADYIDETQETESNVSGTTIKTTTLSTTSTISKIIPLRGLDVFHTDTSLKMTIVDTHTDSYHDGEDKYTNNYGSEPESTKPNDYDLLFPEWMMKWINKVEIFIAYESKLSEGIPHTIDQTISDGTFTTLNASGTRVTKSRKGVLSLGILNGNGEISNINLVRLRELADPLSEEEGHSIDGATNTTETVATVGDISTTVTHTERTPGAKYSRTSSLYAVVEWDFDKENPEPFGKQPAERTAWKEAENNLTKAKIELEEATKVKTAAETLVKTKEDELDKAREALDNATKENEQMLQEALDKVQEELDNARKALVDAEQAVTDKEQNVTQCEEAVAKAKEAFMKLMQEYTGKLR